MEKLIKDCKVGDLLYYVSDPDFHENLNDEIFQVKITEIKRGDEFEGGVCIYKCIIPKGCEYYKGTTEVINPMGTTYGALVYQAESYASLRIKFVSLVKKFLIK